MSEFPLLHGYHPQAHYALLHPTLLRCAFQQHGYAPAFCSHARTIENRLVQHKPRDSKARRDSGKPVESNGHLFAAGEGVGGT
jgi:hypothetical protein